MIRKWVLIFLLLFICSTFTTSQSLSQIGFIIKKAIPSIDTISVIFYKSKTKQIENEARPAIIITKKKFVIFPVEKMSDIATKINEIKKLSNVAIVVITDDSFLTPSTVKFIASKSLNEQIPVISNRDKDTLQGAMLGIFSEDGVIKKHINKIIAAALGLNIPPAFLAECVVDVE
jgi:hypothetical protein